MRYILDFDGVIFNVQLLKDKMAELQIEESNRSKATFDEIEQKDPAFDLTALMFEDAQTFLKDHARNCEIVSSFVSTRIVHTEPEEVQRLYQETKIELAGLVQSIGKEQVHVVGKSKGEMLALLKDRFDAQGEECIFIDDRKIYVEEAEALGIHAFWMNRMENASPERELNEIRSFEELQERIEFIWKK